jgi:hypothetical protein
VRWRLIVSHTLSRWQAVLLGIVVLLGTGLAVVGLFAVGSRQWFRGSTFHVRCGFRSIQGIDAGEVVAIVPPGAPRGDVILRLRLDSTLHSLVRTDATVQIVSEGLIGGKAIEINPGTESAGPAPEDGLLSSRSTAELSEVLDQVKSTLQKVRDGAGPLGLELSATMQQARATMHSFEKSGDAVRKLPIVRSYAQDTLALLVRPECKRDRTVFAETDLFEPGRATLTGPGRKRQRKNLARAGASSAGLPSGYQIQAGSGPFCGTSARAMVLSRSASRRWARTASSRSSADRFGADRWLDSRAASSRAQSISRAALSRSGSPMAWNNQSRSSA